MREKKLAYFLRGLGVGILFVTIIMSISHKRSLKDAAAVVTAEMSKEEIIAKAKEYGMVEGVGMKVDQLLDLEEAEQPIQTTAPEETSAPEVEANTEQVFEVESGQTAAEVAQALEKAGLVDDAKQFHKFLEEKGYSTRIIAKTHTIRINSSYKTIAKQLCD